MIIARLLSHRRGRRDSLVTVLSRAVELGFKKPRFFRFFKKPVFLQLITNKTGTMLIYECISLRTRAGKNLGFLKKFVFCFYSF